ncbi:hypothetical protein HPB49_020863 [Dermacentor silvarum]|uniref:Uncharacterized protein n=1 Tax=Dermacentor silvarum TaxID=543639 RepID=A0ACB8DG37_DERSI|nr:hypothetical protein HPB49_020863 [Dermacentor silvarum]
MGDEETGDGGNEKKEEEEEEEEDAGADDGAPGKGKRPPDSIMVQRKSARGGASNAGGTNKSDSDGKSAASMLMTIGGLLLFAVVVLGVVGFIIYKITQCGWCTASLFAQSARCGDKSSCASIGIDNLAAYTALRRVIGYCSGLASGPLTFLCTPLNDLFPAISAGRRQARAHFHDPFPPDTVTCYVDAAYYQTHGSTARVTMPTPLGIPITSTAGPFSLPTSSLSLELAAIVHATHELTLLPPSPRYRICSDSMAAIRALRDNRLADNLHDDLSDALSLLSPALTLPPPHPRLSTAQVRTLRAIQLNTLITPAHLYLYRYRSDPSCPNCPSTYANVEHIFFSCPAALQSSHYPNPPPPHWRVWLASAAFADQLAMVLLAEEYL